MDRLTIRNSDGAWDVPLRNDNGVYIPSQEVIDRLAAYEDTGLEPEEAEACKVALMGKSLTEIKEIEGISVERMKDLAKAEAEGRLRGLPGAGHLRGFGRFHAGAGPGAGGYDPAGQKAGQAMLVPTAMEEP